MAAMVVGSAVAGAMAVSASETPCYRIGYENSEPYQFVNADGGPAGPAIELLKEAALRKGVCLEWVYAEEGPDEAFGTDKVDLWPLVGNVGDRKDRFHITRPWRLTRFWLVSVAERPIQSEQVAPGTIIALGRGNVAALIASEHFPAARTERTGGIDKALQAVCAGQAPVAIIQDSAADVPVERPTSCLGMNLHFAPVPEAAIGYGIGASYTTPGASKAADSLRAGISTLVMDGTVVSIYYRWFGNTSRETYVIDQVDDAERLVGRLGLVLGFLALLVGLLFWQSWRLRTANRAIGQALQTAALASEAKSRFLSTMSHEIRTPLSGLLGMADLLNRSSLKPEQREEVESISESGKALLGIIDDVLDFSKIEAGKLDLECIDYDAWALLETIDQILGYQARSKGLDLRIEPAEDIPPYLNGDPSRIRQILLNLVGNAVKFAEQGSVTLRCAVDGSELLFEVADTGPGIADGMADLLFHPFQQGDVATNRRHGGTGSGLVISQRLVSAMGGQIGCRNNPERGATFWFKLPLITGKRPAVATQAERAVLGDCSGRIMLAEDDPVNRAVATKMLLKLGFEVDVAVDGQEALTLAGQHAYPIIFLDCRMPNMDGYEAARLIRQNERSECRSVIIALTANAFAEDRERCYQAGMNDYLTKPIDLQTLQETVQKWLPKEVNADRIT
jgi:signal transduction histidine kinase/CheY-like chemotaxis protein